MVLGEENKALLSKYAPALRHELFLLLAEQDGQNLQTPEGKEALRQAAVAALRTLMEQETRQPLIEDLFFTSYYVR
jgi:flagellar FliL protein